MGIRLRVVHSEVNYLDRTWPYVFQTNWEPRRAWVCGYSTRTVVGRERALLEARQGVNASVAGQERRRAGRTSVSNGRRHPVNPRVNTLGKRAPNGAGYGQEQPWKLGKVGERPAATGQVRPVQRHPSLGRLPGQVDHYQMPVTVVVPGPGPGDHRGGQLTSSPL